MIASPGPGGPSGNSTFRRRKFTDKKGKGGRQSGDVDQLEAALEQDAAAVEDLRRDLQTYQQIEVASSHEYLNNLKRTYDKLRNSVQEKEKLHRNLADEVERLTALCTEQKEGGRVDPFIAKIEKLESEKAQLEQKVRDALMQKDIFNHMIKRLNDEGIALSREGQDLQTDIDKETNEVNACNLALQHAKQELRNEEKRFQTLQTKVQDRREQQNARMADIDKILRDRTSLIERHEEKQRLREKVIERSNLDSDEHEEAKLRKMQVVRKVYGSMLEQQISHEEDDLSELEATFQHIKIITGLTDVDEIVHKFLTRAEKAQQLERDADDIRSRIEGLKRENEAQRQILGAMRAESQNTAGNRKAIFDMEKSNQDLNDLKHQCDDAKKRAYRSSVALEELKTAISRFRGKVEGKSCPVPKNDQLADHLKELDLKLGGKMRAVAESLTQEDMSSAGQAASKDPADPNGEVVSFGKVQSDKLTRMLYHKMMLTIPDTGPRNVRVNVRPNLDDLNRRHRRGLLDDFYADFVEPDANADDDHHEDEDEEIDITPDVVVDRATVKKLSNLIVHRDTPKSSKKKKKAGQGGV